jgi:hypothetical protein
MAKTTILLETSTREELRRIGRKDQTYDDLINELIELKRENQDPLDRRIKALQSSGSQSQ